MRPTIRGLFAISGCALVAFSLCGSTWHPSLNSNPASAAEIALYKEGQRLYASGEYTRASEVFRAAASRAERDGSPQQAAMNWNNAGGAALARLDFKTALPDFLKARRTAEGSQLRVPLLFTMNNLAGLYLEMGDPEAAMRVAREAPSGAGWDRTGTSSKVRFQLATALARLHRFDEAEPIYLQAIAEIRERNDFDATARALGNFGNECLEADRLGDADAALSEASRVIQVHKLNASANILRALAKLKKRRGDILSATALFDEAIQVPQGITPRWVIYTDRGEFRLGLNDLRGALTDFREARRIATQMRADIVPADQDRIALEGGLSRVVAGLVDAGNRLAQQTSDVSLLRETFDAAEQDRLWSLRALVPAPNDWRSRLPNTYWDLLARYQNIERSMVGKPSPELGRQAAALQLELQQIEAAASGEATSIRTDGESALAHASGILDDDTTLLSFHVTTSSSWLWAVDRHGAVVYRIPTSDTLRAAVADFTQATRDGDIRAIASGRSLYQSLFGNVPARYLSHKRWLLELDGPLFDLPFAALVLPVTGLPGEVRKNEPIYLFQRVTLQAIPGSLMLEHRIPFEHGPFLAVGDPIYNAADPRYRGPRVKQDVVLPRLPATASELEACSRAWNPVKEQILTGANASLPSVRAALDSHPSVIHFATHVVTGSGFYSSGLIALSLDGSGAMGLMGPAEIVAHTRNPSLVVLNGCHSGQADALPGAGLMGLTRAWIGAGARSVLATRWDIPDEASSLIMVEFYRALRKYPERGPASALQQAQLRVSNNPAAGISPAVWGAYFVLGRE